MKSNNQDIVSKMTAVSQFPKSTLIGHVTQLDYHLCRDVLLQLNEKMVIFCEI